MKILFASDIHGCTESLRRLDQWIAELNPEQIVLLGDYLYHGPRNPLLDDYAPKEAAALLNAHKEKIIAIRGNCDAEVDQLLLEFPMMGDYSILLVDGHRMFLTHGHRWNGENPPPMGMGDLICHGHTHIPIAGRNEYGIFAFNPGSLSLPKGGFPASFGWYEKGEFSVRALQDGKSLLNASF